MEIKNQIEFGSLSLSPTVKKCIDSIVMSLICVCIENQISGHTHGAGMIAAHIPVAYLHESFTPLHQSKIKQILLGIGGFFAFHGGIHAVAEYLGSCTHEQNTEPLRNYGPRFEQLKQAHLQTHGLDCKTRIGIVAGAVGEELYSRLPLRKLLFTNT